MMRASSQIFAAGALLLGTICPAAAETYRWVDDDGVVHLSNSSARFETHQRRASPDRAVAARESQPRSSASGAPSDSSKPKESAGVGRMDNVTTEVMRLSGLDFQAEFLGLMVQGEFERLRSLGFRPGGGATTIITQTFSPDTLRSNMHRSLARSLDQERIGTLLAWLRTPLSQRIVSLESAAATADHQMQMISFINQLPSTPRAPARLTLIHRLERAGDVAQSSAIVMAAAGAALRRTLGRKSAPRSMRTTGCVSCSRCCSRTVISATPSSAAMWTSSNHLPAGGSARSATRLSSHPSSPSNSRSERASPPQQEEALNNRRRPRRPPQRNDSWRAC